MTTRERPAVPMPAPISVFVAATKAFNKLNAGCKVKVEE